MTLSNLALPQSSGGFQKDATLAIGVSTVADYVQMPWDGKAIESFLPWRIEALTPGELLTVGDDGFKPLIPSGASADTDALHETGKRSDNAGEDDALGVRSDGTEDGLDAIDGRSSGDAEGFDAADVAESADAADAAEAEMTTVAVSAIEAGNDLARQAGYDAGYAEGMTAGEAAGTSKGHAAGRSEGEAAVRAELADTLRLLTEAAAQTKTLNDNPEQYFEPLKKLALHLAEELVRGELRQSPSAIERLIERSLEELEHPGKRVLVALHPDDLRAVEAHGAKLGAGLVLQPDKTLVRGSVRVSSNDAVVQDLIQTRLTTLANNVLRDAETWRTHSSVLNEGVHWAGDVNPLTQMQATEDATMVPTPSPATTATDDPVDAMDVTPPIQEIHAEVSDVTDAT
ncbi:MAG: FliH/SctL family protein, partial [Burkholderiaceae bacterium]|nr:FliH/SctL family protein [Burkholderiaceae bacterium]